MNQDAKSICQVIDLKAYRKRRYEQDLPKERAIYLALVIHDSSGAGPGVTNKVKDNYDLHGRK